MEHRGFVELPEAKYTVDELERFEAQARSKGLAVAGRVCRGPTMFVRVVSKVRQKMWKLKRRRRRRQFAATATVDGSRDTVQCGVALKRGATGYVLSEFDMQHGGKRKFCVDAGNRRDGAIAEVTPLGRTVVVSGRGGKVHFFQGNTIRLRKVLSGSVAMTLCRDVTRVATMHLPADTTTAKHLKLKEVGFLRVDCSTYLLVLPGRGGVIALSSAAGAPFSSFSHRRGAATYDRARGVVRVGVRAKSPRTALSWVQKASTVRRSSK